MLRSLLCTAALLAATAATAQVNEYTLEDTGEWQGAPAPPPGSDAAVIAEARRLLALEEAGRARELIDDWLDTNERGASPYLPEAYLLRGDAKLLLGNEYRSLYDYEAVIREFPASGHFLDAIQRELDIGTAYVNGRRRKILGLRIEGAKSLGEELLLRVQERVPGSALSEQAALELASYYYRERDLELAADMYDIFLETYPDSEHARDALLRSIQANIARFKGPAYDGSGLIDARLQIDRYVRRYPAEAVRDGVAEGLAARVDESRALQKLEAARWYLRTGDDTAARFSLQRLLDEFPATSAAQRALEIMQRNGWVQTPGGPPAGGDSPEPPRQAEGVQP